MDNQEWRKDDKNTGSLRKEKQTMQLCYKI